VEVQEGIAKAVGPLRLLALPSQFVVQVPSPGGYVEAALEYRDLEQFVKVLAYTVWQGLLYRESWLMSQLQVEKVPERKSELQQLKEVGQLKASWRNLLSGLGLA